jgi:hypothetical protein
MNVHLEVIINSLKIYSKSLKKTSILIDKPWALIDSDLEIQKLIFKKNKDLIMSKDGQVVMGKWDYLPEARSLLIDRGQDKILCNEGYIDDGVLILKMDGTKNRFYILANENIIPDLDVGSYLKKLRYQKLNITTRKLSNGKILEVVQNHNDTNAARVGNRVSIDAGKVSDGLYRIDKTNSKLDIKDSTIVSIVHERFYKTRNGIDIMVEQIFQECYTIGNKVWIDNRPADDDKYKVIGGKNITVRNGNIIKIKAF